MKESPKIILPEDESIKGALEKKLEEYKRRLNKSIEKEPCMHPELLSQVDPTYIDSLYKVVITEKLLKEGVVDTFELSKEIVRDYGFFNVSGYNNAAGVIDDYCKTGGKNTSKGSLLEK